jgi:HSP20 family protein
MARDPSTPARKISSATLDTTDREFSFRQGPTPLGHREEDDMALIRRTDNAKAPRRGWAPVQVLDSMMRWDPHADFGLRTSFLGDESFTPAFDVRETQDGYVFSADLPGVSEDALSLSIEDDTVTVAGHREQEHPYDGARVLLDERRYGAFSRSFTLPEGVDANRVEARLERGVLTVTVPKRPEQDAHRISLRQLFRVGNRDAA